MLKGPEGTDGKPENPVRVLSLDGGGAKGFYTLGVLREMEAMLGSPLHERFDLVFGTSTGAIIAALIGLGRRVDEILTLYRAHVPRIMGRRTARGRTKALRALAQDVFGAQTFKDMKTGVGIVATRWALERPMIFKSEARQAHGRRATFVPGFGCTVADAVQASCSAYPFFRRTVVHASDGARVELLDGGYCANNPTLFAIADAVAALQVPERELRVVSVGVGVYPEPRKNFIVRALKRMTFAHLLQKTLNINTLSMEQVAKILFTEATVVRINDVFERPELATDLLEDDLDKLDQLYQRGGESFAKYERHLRELMGVDVSATVRQGVGA